jgi:FkbH-like protein
MDETIPGTAVENLNALYATVSKMEREGERLPDQAQLFFLRNFTIEGVEAFLKYYLYRNNIRPVIAFGGYGTMTQEVLSDDSALGRAAPELIVSSLMLEEFDPAYGAPGWRCDSARDRLEALFDILASRTRATIAVNTFMTPLYPELGIAARADASDSTAQVAMLNQFIVDYVRKKAPRFCLTDFDRYLRVVGADAGLDWRYWYLAKAPFKKAFLDIYAQDLSRILLALKGRAKKCLVLDSDNTLWGGVVGEDGLEGIKLDRNEYPGKAFYDFQTSVLHLVERGVLVALCSKNNEADVFEVLEKHPACQLKRSHLSAWRVNWEDKATNLAALAEELNLGLDSFVFVDDSPVERGLIRQMLPQVTVLPVPEKLHTYPPLLLKDGLFDTLSLTGEDRKRTALYQGESRRKEARNLFGSLDDYLTSLQTEALVHRARAEEVPRVAQLTQKTNQFNLTTRRYSEHDIQGFAAGQDSAVFTLTAKDKFGELGLVGVMILTRTDRVGHIDSFLLSCRALGRGLESAMVGHCLENLSKTWGVEAWEAQYIPTRKNVQVENFWPTVGLSEIRNVEGTKTYRAEISTCRWAPPAYVIVRQD